jgi:hypothetical protein
MPKLGCDFKETWQKADFGIFVFYRKKTNGKVEASEERLFIGKEESCGSYSSMLARVHVHLRGGFQSQTARRHFFNQLLLYSLMPRGRCYDRNFRIFSRKYWRFSYENNVMIIFFLNSSISNKNGNFFTIFLAKIFSKYHISLKICVEGCLKTAGINYWTQPTPGVGHA